MGKERDDSAEHGELKRVVNAFLQMIDGFQGRSLLIAATNHEHILDSAVWRRFDEVLHLNLPNIEQLRRLLSVKLKGLRRDFEIDTADFVNQLKGMSHADVERVVRRAAKEMILSGKEFLSERHLISAIHREDARRVKMNWCNLLRAG